MLRWIWWICCRVSVDAASQSLYNLEICKCCRHDCTVNNATMKWPADSVNTWPIRLTPSMESPCDKAALCSSLESRAAIVFDACADHSQKRAHFLHFSLAAGCCEHFFCAPLWPSSEILDFVRIHLNSFTWQHAERPAVESAPKQKSFSILQQLAYTASDRRP